MKKQINYLMMLVVLAVTGVFTSCSPDDYSLASPVIQPGELVEGIAYNVTPDRSNPNVIHCTADPQIASKHSVAWQTPFGLTNGSSTTLQFPFEGEYEVKFGVDTGSGYVWSEPYTVVIDDICTDFLSGAAWEQLAGGVGNSKTWVYDDGQYGYKAGEISYGDPAANPNLGFNSFEENWDPGKGHCGDDAMWDSYMTFDLINGANYFWHDSSTGNDYSGSFSFDQNSYQLQFNGVELMHPSAWSPRLLDWRKGFQIVEMSENNLRIAYIRTPGSWGGEWIEVLNFLSKDFVDNYEAPLPSGIKVEPEVIAALTNEMKYATWKIDESTPFDWFVTDGTRKNIVSDAYKPAPDNYMDYSVKFCSPAADSYNAGSISGTFTMTDNGLITFSNGVEAVNIGTGVDFTTDERNQLQVLAIDQDDQGRVSELWLGRMERDAMGNDIEYLGYHLIATYGGGSETPSFAMTLNYNDMGSWTMQTGPTVYTTGDGTYELTLTGSNSNMDPMLWIDCKKILGKYPNCDIIIKKILIDGKELAFDDSAISRSKGDEADTARRYICNPWGLATCFNDMSVFLFNSEIRVTVEVRYETDTTFPIE